MEKIKSTGIGPGKLVRLVDDALERGAADEALELAEQGVETFPKNIQMRLRLAAALDKSDRSADAVKELQVLLDRMPGRVDANMARAEIALREGDTEAADRHYRTVQKREPDNPQAALGRIDAAIQRKNPAAAVKLADQALTQSSDDLPLLLRQIRALISLRRPLDAQKVLNHLLEQGHDRERMGVRLAEASIHLALSRFDEASRIYAEVAQAHPDAPQPVLGRISTELARGEVVPAQKLVEEALGRFPGDVRFLLRKAAVLRDLFKMRDAHQVLVEAAELAPHDLSVRQQLADSAKLANDIDVEEQQYRAMLEYRSDALVGLVGLASVSGNAFMDIENTIQAQVAKVLSPDEEMPGEIAIELGDLAMNAGDVSTALKYYDLINDPAQGDARRYLHAARCHLMLGAFEEARNTTERFLEGCPDNAEALLIQGSAELALGNVDRWLELTWAVVGRGAQSAFGAAMRLFMGLHILGRHDEANALLSQWEDRAYQRPELGYLNILLRQRRLDDAIAYVKLWAGYADEYQIVNRWLDEISDSEKPWRKMDVMACVGTPAEDDVTPSELVHELLAGIDKSGKSFKVPLLTSRLAWSVADDTSMGFDEWLIRARQGTAAFKVMATKPALIDDLLPYLAELDLTPLQELTAQDQPYLLAATHMGPRFAQVLYRFLPKTVFITNGYFAKAEVPTIPFAVRENTLAAVKSVKFLREGYSLCVAPDTAVEQAGWGSVDTGASGHLFGVPTTIADVVPKLSQELSVPSFFLQPYWRDGKIHFIVERLPDPDPDEDRSVWYNRWADAYLQQLERFMRSAPENQNLQAALWRYLLLRGGPRTGAGQAEAGASG